MLQGGAGLLLAALAGGAPGPAPHPNSFSWSTLEVRGDRLRLELRVQVLSLGEVIEGLDDDLDGHTTPEELADAEEDILAYVQDHYRIVPSAGASAGTAQEIPGTVAPLPMAEGEVFEGPLIPDPLNQVADWVDVVVEYERPAAPFDRLGIHVELFQVTSPGHRDGCTVVWNGEVHADVVNFSLEGASHVFVATEEMLARNVAPVRRFSASGVRWLASAEARAALALALLLVLGARRSAGSGIGAAASAFGAAALGTVLAPKLPLGEVTQLTRYVSMGTILSLVYLALDDLVHREGHARLLEGAAFGFIVGVGAAVAIEPAVALEETPGPALAGHAFGAWGTGFALAVLLSIGLSRLGGERPALGPWGVRVAAALGALALAALLAYRVL